MKKISEQLRKELPGLRGYSETNLKNMRLFYDHWQMLDSNSSVATDELISAIPIEENNNSSVVTDEFALVKSSVATEYLQIIDNQIDIYHTLAIPNIAEFPIEDFFKVPFSHHVEIFTKVEDITSRYYYLKRTAVEHLSVEALEKLIKQKAFENRNEIPNNFVKSTQNPFSRNSRRPR